MELDAEEMRVLGCLAEKQLTTPAQYPLTLNALTLDSREARITRSRETYLQGGKYTLTIDRATGVCLTFRK